MYVVVEFPRRRAAFGRVWKPHCPVTGCKLEADHEIKDGPKWVWRGCRDHAYEEAERLNAEAA